MINSSDDGEAVGAFYVRSASGKLVPAQFLRDRGAPVLDPNPNATRYVLRDRNGVPLKKQNFENYYIVPKGYSLDNVRHFGDYVRSMGGDRQSRDAFVAMAEAFYTGGSQDLQRQYTYANGTPGDPDDPVPAFRHSTSFVLGVVTAQSGIPLQWSKYFGGKLNEAKYAKYWLLRRFGYKNTPDINTEGTHGLDPENESSIEHGFIYSEPDSRPGDRAYLDERREVAFTENASVLLKDQARLNGTELGKRSGGRDVQLASYRYAPSDGSTPTTVTPAMQALNAAKADDAFIKRYMKGDRDAVERMHALHRAAYPEPGDETVGPAVRPVAADNSAVGYSQGTRDLTPARQALEAAKSDSGFVKRYLDGDRSASDHMQSLIQSAYPEPAASGGDGSESGASTPMFQPWTPNLASEGRAPWMQSSLRDYLASAPEYEGDGYSKLAPWTRDQYPAWLRGNDG